MAKVRTESLAIRTEVGMAPVLWGVSPLYKESLRGRVHCGVEVLQDQGQARTKLYSMSHIESEFSASQKAMHRMFMV